MDLADRQTIRSRDELISLIFDLLDENDAVHWKNDTAYTFLQAMAAWLDDAERFYRSIGEPRDLENPSWQVIADALVAASELDRDKRA